MRFFNRLWLGKRDADAACGEDAGGASRLRFGEFTLDTGRQSVWQGSTPIEMPELSYRLLVALLRRAPRLVSKDELISDAWEGAVVSDETLAQRVKLLRQALGDDSRNPRYIAAVRGRGYRMVCAVRTGQQRSRRGILAAALALVFVGAFWVVVDNDDQATTERGVRSLAVLPFLDLTADESRQYFADGMQEELLSRLSQLNGVDVVSRTSVERYRGTNLSIPEIASALAVDAIIEGSAQVEAERVRITVQLIDGETDRHIWASSFDRELTVSNVFAIQQEVAEQVAQALSVDKQEPQPRLDLPTENVAAYNEYLLGRYHTFRQTPSDLQQAVVHLQTAVDIDPEFAEAWTTLGWAWSFRGTNYGSSRPADVFPLAKDAALKALSLNQELGNAHSLYADILTWYDWDFAAAERSYRKALELDPLDLLGYALFLSIQGRHDESLQLIERRLETQPDDVYVQVNAAWLYRAAGRLDDALAAATMADGHPDAEAAAGYTHLQIGNTQQAVETFRDGIRRHGRTYSRLSNLAVAMYANGDAAEAAELLDEILSADGYVAPSLPSAVLFAAGDVERGFEFLAEAVRERDRGALFLLTGPTLAALRGRPEFGELLGIVGLDESATEPW